MILDPYVAYIDRGTLDHRLQSAYHSRTYLIHC